MENNNCVFVFDSAKPTTCQDIIEKLNIDCPKKSGVVYKAEFKADEYPNGTIRVRELTSGDVIYVSNTGKDVKLGDKFMNYPAVVSEIYYEPKKWWQFWKPKKQIGYSVKWI